MKRHRMNMLSNCPLLGACLGVFDLGFGVWAADVHVFDEGYNRDYRLIGIAKSAYTDSYDLYFENKKDNQRTALVTTPDVFQARFSPNMEYIAFHRRETGEGCFREDGMGEMQSVRVFSRSNPLKIWTTSECASNFNWSPDSEHLAYSVSTAIPFTGEVGYQIRVLELGTNKEFEVTSGTTPKMDPRFSPDGKLILYRPSFTTITESPMTRTLAMIDWRTGLETELVSDDVSVNIAWPEGPRQVRQWLPGNILVWDVDSPAHPEIHGSWALDVSAKQAWKFSGKLGTTLPMPKS